MFPVFRTKNSQENNKADGYLSKGPIFRYIKNINESYYRRKHYSKDVPDVRTEKGDEYE